ncbi:MAG: TIGR01841 family phasin [Thiomonas sp.]|uniref:TIGR01841 family phasin n=1 Tax=Thiomonas sp. TaxID=2047785 RepID=UPI002A35ED48|nr:TIGR01841 family phasin [Thiomonas sp.]MDY0328902.1 TIGR01841 family phasin [Thiomonas sp.]
MMTPEQFTATQKAQFEAFFDLAAKSMDHMEKLIDLNMQAAKTTLQENAEHTLALLSVKDLQELSALQSGWMQPMAEKALSYSRHAYEIASGAQAELAKTAESQISETHKKFMELAETAAKNAPAGSETAVAMMKSAMNAASNAYDSVQKVTKQAAEAVEANMNAVTSTAMKAAQSTARNSGNSAAKRAAA